MSLKLRYFSLKRHEIPSLPVSLCAKARHTSRISQDLELTLDDDWEHDSSTAFRSSKIDRYVWHSSHQMSSIFPIPGSLQQLVVAFKHDFDTLVAALSCTFEA